jgi:hypothetical protein
LLEAAETERQPQITAASSISLAKSITFQIGFGPFGTMVAKSCETVPAQPVDATPSNQLI